MGFKTTIAKASSTTNSLRTTVPRVIISQFNLKSGDKLDWTLKVEGGALIIIVKPEKNKGEK